MQAPAIPENETARLAALYQRSLIDTLPEERFDRFTLLARQIFGVEIVLVSLVDTNRQWFKSKQGLDACETGRDISFCGHAILYEEIFLIPDALSDPRFADNPLVTDEPHIRFYAGAPLSTADGFRIGTLCLIDSHPRQLTAHELLMLRNLADCVEHEMAQAGLEQEQKLQKIEREQLRQILETSPVAVRIMRLADKKLVFVNQSFCDMVRYPKEEALSLDPIKFYQHIEDYEAIVARLQRGESIINFPVELTSKGNNIWALTSFFSIEFEGAAASLAWIYEVTELVQALKGAEAANRAKSAFLSSMSHELRTPMNAVLGFGQILEYDATLTAEQRESVQHILRGGQHLLDLINQVLDLSRIEAGQMTLSLEPVEMNAMIEECLELANTLAEKRGIIISHGELQGMVVYADRVRLKQVLLNLLSNATKYNRAGGSVNIGMQMVAGERLRLDITDTGDGIPADKLGELFQPFNRLGAEVGTIEGTGIGLTITRSMVEMMGGTVEVRSEVGVGSTFSVELPIAMPDTPITQTKNVEKSAAVPAMPKGHAGQRLLLAEDNPVNQRLAVVVLSKMGYSVDVVYDGEKAVTAAASGQYALVLMDCQMPQMDGYQATVAIRQAEIGSTRHLPIVAMTANAMEGDREKCLAAGMDDYVTKPINIPELQRVLDAWLSSSTQAD